MSTSQEPSVAVPRSGFRERALRFLLAPVSPVRLAWFRIIFGLFMVLDIAMYIRMDLVRNMFVLPALNFTYDFFGWMHPMPELGMDILLWSMLGFAVLITLGVFFQWACWGFSLAYLYLLLLDKSIFNNHIYLFLLLPILLSFTQADRYYSLRPGRREGFAMPRWQLALVQLQFIIVYFYGGIAKLKYDWIFRAEPVRGLARALPDENPFLSLFKTEAGIQLLNAGGLVVDLAAPFLLLYKPARKFGLPVYAAFNAINSRLFGDIGIFPYVMFFSLILFLDPWEWRLPDSVRRFLRFDALAEPGAFVPGWSRSIRRASVFLVPFMIFQLVFPFRGFFLPNPMDWTTIGNRFSWRMKVDTRDVRQVGFFIQDRSTGEYVPVKIESMINTQQMIHLCMDPRSVVQFARFLAKEAKAFGVSDPYVHGRVLVSYNNRPDQLFFDPDIDLAQAEIVFYKKADWVVPVADLP